MSRRDDAPGALPAHRGAAQGKARRGDLAGTDSGSAAERGARSDLPRRTMVDLVAAATLAPSMHNTQPWRFRLTRPARRSSCTPTRRGCSGLVIQTAGPLHIACGAALLNLRLAAVVAGRQPVLRLLPDPDQPLLLATVRLAGPCQAQADEVELHAAHPGAAHQPGPVQRAAGAAGSSGRAGRGGPDRGCDPAFPGPPGGRPAARLARDAERALLADPAYRAELARWAGGHRDREGIPDEVAGPPRPRRAPPRCATSRRPPGRCAMPGSRTSRSWPCCATPFGTRADWLRAGQALQRVLLTATLRGIAVSPLTQPLETADAWLVRDPAVRLRIPADDLALRLRAAGPAHPAPAHLRRAGYPHITDQPMTFAAHGICSGMRRVTW